MWVSNPRSWDYEYHSLPTELAGVYDFNEETVFVNDHLFFAIFVELFFFFSKYRRIEKLFFHLRSSSASNGIAKDCVLNIIKSFCPTWRSNARPWDDEYHALPTEQAGLYDVY